MSKPLKHRIKERPVRLASVVVGVLMFLATRYLGKEQADSLQQWFVLIAPIIAGFVTERFTFSQTFVQEIVRLIPNDGNANLFAMKNDSRLIPRHGKDVKERGQSTLTVLLIILIVVILVLLLGGRGRF